MEIFWLIEWVSQVAGFLLGCWLSGGFANRSISESQNVEIRLVLSKFVSAQRRLFRGEQLINKERLYNETKPSFKPFSEVLIEAVLFCRRLELKILFCPCGCVISFTRFCALRLFWLWNLDFNLGQFNV